MTFKSLIIATLSTLLAVAPNAYAESPMITDDAGTLERGGKKFELGSVKLGPVYAHQLSFGIAPVGALELGTTIQSENDKSLALRSRLLGLSAKWVPWHDGAWSAGVKAEWGTVRVAGANTSMTALTGLLTWRKDSGVALHGNLGRTWQNGPEDNRWALGIDIPITASLQATLEGVGSRTAGASSSGAQAGLRWELQKGWKAFTSVGRVSAQRAASIGTSYEF